MKTISIEEAKDIKLMKRIDVKYVVNNTQLSQVADYIFDNFYIVKNDTDEVFLKYHSLYFDTDDMQMHRDHVEKKAHRQKIRVREYQSHDKFLEIKDKNNHVTTKIRVPVTSYDLDGERQWISDNLMYDTKTLKKKLDVEFYRMTFISLNKQIRMTIDSYIHFYNYDTQLVASINDIIIEIKKTTEDKIELENMLNNIGVIESGFSKYNIGIKLTTLN